KAREKLIAVMQSEEYRKKQSESKMGKKNGMWNPNLTEADRMDRAGKAMNRRWVTGVKKRDNNTCVICSASYATMVAHHLNGYHWDVENRYNIDNGVTLCEHCHNNFHRIYGMRDNTKEQFDEYKQKVKSEGIMQLALL